MMDLLFSKYASPFLLLDTCIGVSKFSAFIDEFIETLNEKNEWEFYLHKVEGKSFEEFRNTVRVSVEKPKLENIETAIKESQNIINGFIPQ